MVDKVLELPEGSKMMLLATIVKERKGEHVKTLENLAAQGFIRARIDGETCDLTDPPKLELHKKHTIEVIVDRFKVRSDLQQRLAESFETALELSGGIVVVARWKVMAKSRFSRLTLLVHIAVTACANLNHACSPSTTQPVLVQPVMV